MNALARFASRAADMLGRESTLISALRPGYERLLDWMAGGRGLPWSINRIACRIDPRARAAFPTPYESGASAYLASQVREGDLCFDVGANVGAYVIQLAHWSGPTGHVVAFEPNPIARTVLMRHVRLNGLASRVEVVSSAIAADSGFRRLHVAGTDGHARLDVPNPVLGGLAHPVEVPVTTVDAFCNSRRVWPRWIVMDVEGYEIAALQGARQTLLANPAVGVVVELHPSAWAQSGTCRSDVEALLHELCRAPVALDGQQDPLGQHGLVYLRSTGTPD